jgi:DnaK suppressor protein
MGSITLRATTHKGTHGALAARQPLSVSMPAGSRAWRGVRLAGVDETFLNEMRERLQSRAAELRDTIARIEGTTGPVSPNNAIGRLTRLDAMQATSMRRAAARDHDLELHHVGRALEAMAAGEYGVCRRCKEDMAEARLRAKPEAFLCVACISSASSRR